MASTEPDLSTAVWRKSSYSNGSGGECVEVATLWRKSSYSNGSGGDCVEVRDDLPGLVPVRDSKVPDGSALLISDVAWGPFVGWAGTV
ncbi:DUF397 domain-containing protein [Streptomyces prunicolor]|uniref:DUF397 domain-containing protein n=1 Tax=Streptomyces prunicolor TaxID=67348 RepID=UPI0005B8B432|nr:DUF397 domain-containing protein [Streptomyces prunicolor]